MQLSVISNKETYLKSIMKLGLGLRLALAKPSFMQLSVILIKETYLKGIL